MCPHERVYWRHLANTIKLVLPSAHLSSQPKRQIDRFSRLCTAHGRKSIYFTMGDPFPSPKIAPSRGGSGPLLIHDSLNQTEPTIQTASRSLAVFAQVTAESPYTLQWAPHSPKLPLPTEIWTPSNIRFHRPIQAHKPNSISIGSAVLHR